MELSIFIKKNPIQNGSSLESEAAGLRVLREHQNAHGLNLPNLLKVSPEELHLQKIFSARPNQKHWRQLGEGIAKLHMVQGEEFGFETSNFIGLNPQKNTPSKNWGQFFFENRLRYQVGLIQDETFRKSYEQRLETQHAFIVYYLNAHSPQPSLLHGDFWSGNVMFDESGPWLIDPAVYYGDREVDIAMSKMFGGFHDLFYATYQQSYPLSEGFEKREVIYNLYHYLNHYNIFGHSYLSGVENGFSYIEKLAHSLAH